MTVLEQCDLCPHRHRRGSRQRFMHLGGRAPEDIRFGLRARPCDPSDGSDHTFDEDCPCKQPETAERDAPEIEVSDSLADIAAEHGVTLAQLRQALREAHPDASVAEVMLAAREVEPG